MYTARLSTEIKSVSVCARKIIGGTTHDHDQARVARVLLTRDRPLHDHSQQPHIHTILYEFHPQYGQQKWRICQ